MGNLANIYQDIADILSFETLNVELEKKISNPKFNWEAIVIEGSKHLILPAIYCRLKDKNLLSVLPEDLNSYLEELTAINRNRNKSIYRQAKELSQLLQSNNIDHVFLKGTALLFSDCYNDIAERMIGDIDILIEKDNLDIAFKLIKNNGYNKTYGYAYKTIDYRHLDRLISSKELAAVELHGELLNKSRTLIDLKQLFKSKMLCDGIYIPNKLNICKHLILGWQINDNGYYYNYLNFKLSYDITSILTNKNINLLDELLNINFCKKYLELTSLYFREISIENTKYITNSRIKTHKTLMKYKYLRVITLWVKSTLLYVSERIYLLKSNKNYRKHLYCKIFVPNKM